MVESNHPSEKLCVSQHWIISPARGETKKYLEPPSRKDGGSRFCTISAHVSLGKGSIRRHVAPFRGSRNRKKVVVAKQAFILLDYKQLLYKYSQFSRKTIFFWFSNKHPFCLKQKIIDQTLGIKKPRFAVFTLLHRVHHRGFPETDHLHVYRGGYAGSLWRLWNYRGGESLAAKQFA